MVYCSDIVCIFMSLFIKSLNILLKIRIENCPHQVFPKKSFYWNKYYEISDYESIMGMFISFESS